MQVMKGRERKLSAILALCALLVPAGRAVLAQRPANQTIGATHGQIEGAIAGIAGAGALIGILAYVAVKHNPGVIGCARSGPDGMTLTSESDKQTYTLVGDVAGIKPGNRVRVSGKKGKKKSAGTRELLVEKVSKDFGPCEVASASR
jgi:hypothetical protein